MPRSQSSYRRSRRNSRSFKNRVRDERPPGWNHDFWDASMNRKHFDNYAAFTAPRDHKGRVMVVKNRYTGDWMLPGGLANLGERSSKTARRETYEEAGVSPKKLRRVHKHKSVSLFDAPGAVSRSHRKRLASFHKRKDRRETSDYGFVDPSSAMLRVTSYDGTPKRHKSTSFRTGTVRHLRQL